ncbi:HAD domain-containing protein [Paenibacillus caseinilyticus]|uniref:HAD domain-containing protein n=1 Tax=Paenibacillus mucilaginosus TaxID=61624 RepID=UPI001F4CBB7A|nr:HAD domain-containing protein [Paenibacillus mucilaginosus]
MIFLDIDGVLVTSRHWVQSAKYFGHEFDPVCSAYLKEIVARTGAAIVVTSSWREGRTLEQIQSIFEINDITGVAGMTPVMEGQIRGREIETYLRSAGHSGMGIEAYIILDDEEEMGSLRSHLIETEFPTGITEEIMDEAVRRLLVGK